MGYRWELLCWIFFSKIDYNVWLILIAFFLIIIIIYSFCELIYDVLNRTTRRVLFLAVFRFTSTIFIQLKLLRTQLFSPIFRRLTVLNKDFSRSYHCHRHLNFNNFRHKYTYFDGALVFLLKVKGNKLDLSSLIITSESPRDALSYAN